MKFVVNENKTSRRPAIFLDRDGTLIEDTGYLSSPENIVWKNGVIETLRTFADAGYLLILVTNQSGVGRGYFPETSVHKVHDQLTEDLRASGVQFDGIYYCPHAPEDGCECRKPSIGMFLEAVDAHSIDIARSWFIGDTCTDIEAGTNIGIRTILLSSDLACPVSPTYRTNTFKETIAYIL